MPRQKHHLIIGSNWLPQPAASFTGSWVAPKMSEIYFHPLKVKGKQRWLPVWSLQLTAPQCYTRDPFGPLAPWALMQHYSALYRTAPSHGRPMERATSSNHINIAWVLPVLLEVTNFIQSSSQASILHFLVTLSPLQGCDLSQSTCVCMFFYN